MIRGTAVFLVTLTSLALGHVPCCLLPGHCIESRAEADVPTCCSRCRPEPRPAAVRTCTCPELVGTVEHDAPAEFVPAWLPDCVAALESAPARVSVLAVPIAPAAPPRTGATLPLLL